MLYTLGGFILIWIAVLFVLGMEKPWFRIALAVFFLMFVCSIAVYVERYNNKPSPKDQGSNYKESFHSVKMNDSSHTAPDILNVERDKIQQLIVDEDYKDDCLSGWFRATNVDIELKLSCLRENESFELNCPEYSEKANGMCLVKWF